MWTLALRAPRSTSSACCSVLERCSNPAWKSSRHSHTSFIVTAASSPHPHFGASCRDSCSAASPPHGCYATGASAERRRRTAGCGPPWRAARQIVGSPHEMGTRGRYGRPVAAASNSAELKGSGRHHSTLHRRCCTEYGRGRRRRNLSSEGVATEPRQLVVRNSGALTAQVVRGRVKCVAITMRPTSAPARHVPCNC